MRYCRKYFALFVGDSPQAGRFFYYTGGVLVKSFTHVSGFAEETPQSAYGCQLSTRHALRVPFQGSLLRKLFVCSSAAMSKPSGGIRSLPSLSAWGLPTPVVAFSCIGNVDIQVFSCAGGRLYFIRRLQAVYKPPLKREGNRR